ncbi:unnamed protein product, partial [Brenthis ino]
MPRSMVFKSQSRQMIYNVYCYLKKASKGNMYDVQIMTCTAEATKSSVSTVRRVIKEAKAGSITGLRTPGKNRKGKKPITGVSNLDKGVIKRCIHNYHVKHQELPVMAKLVDELRSEINFKGSISSLRRIIRELGFKMRKAENKLSVLLEKTDLRLLRINYLKEMQQYRQEGRPIVYTYVYSTRLKAKNDNIVILYAASETGCVPNALLTFRSCAMTYEYYEKWIRSQLIPNLPENSVVVVDNAPYHNKQHESSPSSNSKKSVLQQWLTERQIPFTSEMYKPQLYQLIRMNEDKKFTIDLIMAEHNHTVLRLPPTHPDLNPIEIMWTTIMENVNNIKGQIYICMINSLIMEKVNEIGEEEWKNVCAKVISNEKEYAKCDKVVDELTDEIVVKPEQTSDNSSSESEDECISFQDTQDSSGSGDPLNTDTLCIVKEEAFEEEPMSDND